MSGFRFSGFGQKSDGSLLAPYGTTTNPAYVGAVAPMLGQFANAAGGMASNAGQSQATLGAAGMNAMSNASQGYASGIGNMATAMANERSNMYGANAMAEAARMGALGNLGSAGLGAYGSMGNNAMQAWAQNQNAYNQSLASMQNANQSALGGLGASRNAALASLAGPMAAQSLAGSFGGGGGMGFSATAGGSPVASGNVFAPGGGGFSFNRSGGDMSGLRGDIMSPDMRDAAMYANTDAMNRLDGQHASARYMPSQMLDQGLSGLMALTNNSTGQLNSGMNQFYGNQALAGNQFYDQMPSLLQALNAAGAGRGIAGMMGSAQSGISGAMNQGMGFLNNVLGSLTRSSPT